MVRVIMENMLLAAVVPVPILILEMVPWALAYNDYDYDVWGPQFRGQPIPQYDGAYDPTQTYTTTFADGTTYSGHVAPTPFVARGKDNLKNFIQTGLLQVNSVASQFIY